MTVPTNEIMENALNAFFQFKKIPPEKRAAFLESIAVEIELLGDTLINSAQEETNLPSARLIGERSRTTMQLRMFAEMVREGSWVEASIDTALPDRLPIPKPDIRKIMVPLGPVVVFGASNFPFAYSTAGGDTASALAAGCSVIVKAHPAHPITSELVYGAIKNAIMKCNMPEFVFQHVHGADFETGKALVQHPATAAVGFTGSLSGGKALYDYANERKKPIPVFSEMGSINPVVILPDTLQKNSASLVNMYCGSITLGMGQFCTNPGLIIAIQSESLNIFIESLSNEIAKMVPTKMLHEGIRKSYLERKEKALAQTGVEVFDHPKNKLKEVEASPIIAAVSGKNFLNSPYLHEEIFGPYSLVVKCIDVRELQDVWQSVSGQLTTTVMGTDKDLKEYVDLIEIAQNIAGRIVFNNVPTGVEVCPSMVHGGPFPACTDSRFTAVGTQAVKRWVRPVCYQNCPEFLMPEEIKNANPKRIWRLINGRQSNIDVE